VSDRPRLLDLFCGAGGAAMGYHRAGFDVAGVDIKPQPHYPFEFHQGDALTWPLDGFDAIHASPPCQRYSQATKVWRGRCDSHPDLVAPTRERLAQNGRPYVIENVIGAPLINAIMLCGTAFPELRVRRHRLFECSFPIMAMPCNHAAVDYAVPVYGHSGAGANRGRERDRGRSNTGSDWREAMGIDWMTNAEIVLSIPPAYTQFIGEQLMRVIRS
jgi:DNA (cytosine-5)-methyltransferase 1